MIIVVWIIVGIVFLYTSGFAWTLWKEQNKVGSIAVFLLAVSIAIVPFFADV